MKISIDAFEKWLQEYFDPVIVYGDEYKIDSPFCDDTKGHLWCNATKNCYHCWKSDKHGNLCELVSEIAKCSYQEAVSLLSDDNDIRQLEERARKVLSKAKNGVSGDDKLQKPKPLDVIQLPPRTFRIIDLSPLDQYRKRAEKYLSSRKVPSANMFVCVGGEYADRIIIPYYGRNGELIYWNGRDISGKSPLRYLGPDNEKIGKKDVLWMSSWRGTKLYITEGEFDAMSLAQAGLTAGALGGKNFHEKQQVDLLYDKQIEIVRSYRICMSFDNDKSGTEALNKIGESLLRDGITEVTYVRPPQGYKDWNSLLVTKDAEVVRLWVAENEKVFDREAFKLFHLT